MTVLDLYLQPISFHSTVPATEQKSHVRGEPLNVTIKIRYLPGHKLIENEADHIIRKNN